MMKGGTLEMMKVVFLISFMEDIFRKDDYLLDNTSCLCPPS